MEYFFTTPLWAWTREPVWYFVTVPAEQSDDIRDRPRMPRGFGSVKVRATIGGSAWDTSVFPSDAGGTYILPVKKAVRQAEGLSEGDPVEVRLALLEL